VSAVSCQARPVLAHLGQLPVAHVSDLPAWSPQGHDRLGRPTPRWWAQRALRDLRHAPRTRRQRQVAGGPAALPLSGFAGARALGHSRGCGLGGRSRRHCGRSPSARPFTIRSSVHPSSYGSLCGSGSSTRPSGHDNKAAVPASDNRRGPLLKMGYLSGQLRDWRRGSNTTGRSTKSGESMV